MGGESTSAIEFGQRLTETLARFGVAGRVDVVNRIATLVGHGPSVSAEVGLLLDQWPGLTDDARQRRVTEIARRLAADRRTRSEDDAGNRGPTIPEWLRSALSGLALIAVGSTGLIGYQRWAASRDAARTKPVVADYDAYEHERHERAARVCDATRSRVMRGAAVGPSDVEGWVVELWALRDGTKPGLWNNPALAQFIAPVPGENRSRIIWPNATSLVAADGPDTTATTSEANVPESGPPTWNGLRIVLSGRYVIPYFDETQRQDYMRFAPALSEALKVDYAALYARCEDGTAHYIGAWFRGPSPGGAVASMIYAMGTFGEHPSVRSSLLVPEGLAAVDRQFAFRSISAAALPLKKARVMSLIGTENGAIAGKDDAVSTVTFPFRDANRASRATRSVARELGIADDR